MKNIKSENTINSKVISLWFRQKIKILIAGFERYKTSLTLSTLVNMGLRLTLVVVVISAINYWHLMSQLDGSTQASLLSYIIERGQREEAIFVLAEDNHTLLHDDFLEQFTANSDIDWPKRFDRYFLRWTDGSIRDAPENVQLQNVDTDHHATSFIPKNTTITPDFQKRMVLCYELVERYGVGWRDRFFSTYITLPNGSITMFYPKAPWGLAADGDLDITTFETTYLGDWQHNPERKTVWTGVYADPVTDDAMVSAVTPIDSSNGRHLASIEHDVVLTNLLHRVIEDHLDGAYNLLVRTDGQLVAEPNLMAQIESEAGRLSVQTAGDDHLKRIFALAQETSESASVVYNRRDREYLAIARLRGPDWYLMTVYPESLLREQALSATRFLFLLGLASLCLEVLLLLLVLRQQVAVPLGALLGATQQVASGQFDVKLDTQRQDELGQLAAAFTKMTSQLQNAFTTLERRVAERTDELKSATLAAESANHAKSEFLANMSHELRTPLNGVLGYAQILAQAPELSKKSRDGINTIHQCGSHLLTLINDVLDLSKIEARKLELNPNAIHLPALLQGVVEMCEVRAQQKHLDFVYQPSDRLPDGVVVDEKRLRQVLINLLGNAIKFTEQGTVTLMVEVLESTRTELAKLKFQVADTGVGIASADLTKLFAAFEQVGDRTKQSEGTGLGLAISQQIVQLMGADIEVQSQVGEGSQFTFVVQLPIATHWTQHYNNVAGQQNIKGYEGEQRRILVVDDRWENRGVLVNLLEPLGFDLAEAENGEQGLAQIAQFQPHLVITDLAMPVLNGFEMLKQIRQSPEFQRQKVIVSSASVTPQDQQMAFNAGGDDFLPKPVEAKALLELIAQHLELTWQYEEIERSQSSEQMISDAMLIPPPEVLQDLLKTVQMGKFRKVRQQLEALTEHDQRYLGFAQPLVVLTKQFNGDELETLLNQHLQHGGSQV